MIYGVTDLVELEEERTLAVPVGLCRGGGGVSTVSVTVTLSVRSRQ